MQLMKNHDCSYNTKVTDNELYIATDTELSTPPEPHTRFIMALEKYNAGEKIEILIFLSSLLYELEPYVKCCFNVVQCFIAVFFFVEDVDVFIGERNIAFIFRLIFVDGVPMFCNVVEYPYLRIPLAGSGGDQ